MSILAAIQTALRVLPAAWARFPARVTRWGPLEFTPTGFRIDATQTFSHDAQFNDSGFEIEWAGQTVVLRVSKPAGFNSVLTVTWPDGYSWRFRWDGSHWHYDRFNF